MVHYVCFAFPQNPPGPPFEKGGMGGFSLNTPEFNKEQECNIAIHARHDVIHHDSTSTGESPLEIACGEYLQNIEKPEKDKTGRHVQHRRSNQKHGPLKTDDLVDNNTRRVLFAKHPLSFPGNITRENGDSHDKYKIKGPGQS